MTDMTAAIYLLYAYGVASMLTWYIYARDHILPERIWKTFVGALLWPGFLFPRTRKWLMDWRNS